MWQDTRLIQENLLHFCKLIVKYQENKEETNFHIKLHKNKIKYQILPRSRKIYMLKTKKKILIKEIEDNSKK